MLRSFGNPCSSYFNVDSFSFTWNIHLKFVLVWSGLRNIKNFIKSTGEGRLAFVKDIKACFIIFSPMSFSSHATLSLFFNYSLIPLIFYLCSSFCPCKADKKHVKRVEVLNRSLNLASPLALKFLLLPNSDWLTLRPAGQRAFTSWPQTDHILYALCCLLPTQC